MILPLALAALPTSVLHVDDDATGAADGSSWADAFPSLQDALAAAAPGDQVWVAAGTYRPDQGAGRVAGDRAATFLLREGVQVYGGFQGSELSLAGRTGLFDATVLSGDLAGDDGAGFVGNDENSLHVVTALGIGASARLDGFRIVGGSANGALDAERRGAGLYLEQAEPVVANCAVEGNEAMGDGGGLWIDGASPLFVQCDFVGNHALGRGGGSRAVGAAPDFVECSFVGNTAANGAGGADSASGSAGAFVRCRFESNRAEAAGAGGMGCAGSSPLVLECDFVGNLSGPVLAPFGGGLGVEPDPDTSAPSLPALIRCRFLGNEALGSGGAIYCEGSDLLAVSCLFSGNRASGSPLAGGDGGAVFAELGSRPRFVGCSFSENAAVREAGGIYLSSSQAEIAGSILWGNVDAAGGGLGAQLTTNGGPVQVDHSCVEGWDGLLGGAGNHGLDPQFFDPLGADGVAGTHDDDLRITVFSPCIDAADASALPPDTFDIDADANTAEPLPLDLAGNARLTDVGLAPDTGPGAAPVLDMGALEFPILFTVDDEVSVSGGGTQTLVINAGTEFASLPYLVLGTTSGSSPGVPVDGLLVPLNIDDYTLFTLTSPNTPPLAASFGTLDSQGAATARFSLPQGSSPSLVGVQVHHAVVAIELLPGLLRVALASSAVPLSLLP